MNEITNQYLNKLVMAAAQVYNNAFVPYSGFKVGAAILTSSYHIYNGCNVEFSDYLALHAELNAIGSAVSNGETDFIAIVVYSNSSPPVLPCGFCRQKLYEFLKLYGHDIDVIAVNKENERIVSKLSKLLPGGNIPV